MRNRIALLTLFSLLFINSSYPAEAAKKVLSADTAQQNYRCIDNKSISMSKNGPLICSKGIWKLIPSNQDSVATRAYRSLLKRYNSMPIVAPNLLLRVDPAAGEWKDKIVKGFIAAARLWGTSSSADPALPLYISESAEYISKNLANDGIIENPEDAQRNRNAVAKGQSQAGSHGTYFDFLFTESNAHDNGFYQVGPHEYTHFSQKVFSNSRAFQNAREFWIEEGCAQFVGTNMGGLIGLPQNQRDFIVQDIQSGTNVSKISDFSNSTPAMYSNPKFQDVYDIGSIGCEALVAVAGIDSLELIFRELSNEGTTLDMATNNVLHMSLENLVAFAQEYLDSIIRKKPLTLNDLSNRFKKLQSS